MPRKRRATRARIQNLSKIRKKGKKEDINDNYVFVEPDALDTLDPLDVPSDTMPKEEDDDEGSCVEILDGGSDAAGICEESELAKFSRILFTAQKRAMEAEAARGKKRKTYTGHSQKTAYRRKRYRSHLATQGYLPVPEFMKLMESRKTAQELISSQNLTVLPFEESEESSDDDAVTASEDTSMERAPAVNEVCYQVTQGLVASEQHHRAVQELREEEEESTESEGECGGTTREDRQGVGSRNGLSCDAPVSSKDLPHRVLMESAGPPPAQLLPDRPEPPSLMTPALVAGHRTRTASSAQSMAVPALCTTRPNTYSA